MKRWKKILLGVLAGALISWGVVEAATLRNKPGGKTKNEVIWEALRDTVNTDGTFEKVEFTAQSLTAAADSGSGSTILEGTRSCSVVGTTTNANDWIVLPTVADVPVGHCITIVCSTGVTNFELRTPATSAEEINSEDCDGTKEYLCTDTEIIYVTKISDTIGWMANAYTAIGAVATAVVPD